MSIDSYFEIYHIKKSMMQAQDICACKPWSLYSNRNTCNQSLYHHPVSRLLMDNKIYTTSKKSYAHQRYSDEDDKDESNKETRRLLFESLAPKRNSSVAENLSRTELIAW